jgi:hypothetical protein
MNPDCATDKNPVRVFCANLRGSGIEVDSVNVDERVGEDCGMSRLLFDHYEFALIGKDLRARMASISNA